MPSSKLIKSAAGFIISIALIVWLYFSIQWKEVWQQLLSVNYWILLPIFALLIINFYLRALRWRYLLPKPEEPVSISKLFDSIMMGNFASYVLPLRAGEFIRPYLLSNMSSYHFSTTFSSVIVERFFDLATVLFTFAYVVTRVEGLPDWSKHGALVLSIMALGILIFIIVGSFFPKAALSLVSRCIFFVPAGIKSKINKFMEEFLVSAAVVNNLKNLVWIIFLSAVVWLESYYVAYVGLFMLPGHFTFDMALTLSVVVALAVAAPSAPGFIGVYQTACIAAFNIFGLSSESAVTYSIVTHLVNYILFCVCAVIFCLRNDFKFSNILSIKHKETA